MQRQHFQRFFSSSTYAGKLAVLPKLERLPDRVTLTAEAVGEFFAQDMYHGKQVGLGNYKVKHLSHQHNSRLSLANGLRPLLISKILLQNCQWFVLQMAPSLQA